jgi:hypothetical protein
MSQTIICSCGRQLRASKSHVGRTVTCPNCNIIHPVLSPDVPAAAPDAPVPEAAPAQPARSWGPTLWRVLGLLFIAVALTLAGGAVWWTWPTEPDVDELRYVPRGQRGLVVVRVAELWNVPEVRKGLAEAARLSPEADLASSLEKATGLRPQDVERAYLALPALGPRFTLAVLKTARPYDRAKVLELLGGPQPQEVFQKQFYVGPITPGWAPTVVFLSPRVLMYGNEVNVRLALGMAASGSEHDPYTLKLIEDSKEHLLVVRGLPSPTGRTLYLHRRGIPQPPWSLVQTQLESIVLKMDIGARARLTGTAPLRSFADVEDFTRWTRQTQKQAVAYLARLAKEDRQPYAELASALDESELKVEGKEAQFSAAGDGEGVVASLALLYATTRGR